MYTHIYIVHSTYIHTALYTGTYNVHVHPKSTESICYLFAHTDVCNLVLLIKIHMYIKVSYDG